MDNRFRAKHSQGVAEYMRINANRFNLSPNDMYILGLLHDIGYQFLDESESVHLHGIRGASVLKEQGYKYANEIKYHGRLDTDYKSKALDLLNEADLSIGPNGEQNGVEWRLLDIMARHGRNSNAYKNAVILAIRLNLIDIKSSIVDVLPRDMTIDDFKNKLYKFEVTIRSLYGSVVVCKDTVEAYDEHEAIEKVKLVYKNRGTYAPNYIYIAEKLSEDEMNECTIDENTDTDKKRDEFSKKVSQLKRESKLDIEEN